MQAASSVMKAIEKAWEDAGKPREFSVKIFEEPKKNFIGITVQSAKVGIFFTEKPITKVPEKEEYKKREQTPKTTYTTQQRPEQSPAQKQKIVAGRNMPPQKEFVKKEKVSEARPIIQEQKQQKEIWTDDMVTIVKTWLTEMLHNLNRSDISFICQPSMYQLHVQFNAMLNQKPEKDQQLMRSFALILMQTLRHALKRPLRGFKIMLTTKNS